MSTRVFDHDWMALDFDEGAQRLDLIWKTATADMGAEGFQLCLAMYASEAVARRAEKLLVDTREFRFGGFADVEPWRQATIIPLYNHGGAKRFGYVFAEGMSLPPSQPAGDGVDFETRYFDSFDAVVDWLAS